MAVADRLELSVEESEFNTSNEIEQGELEAPTVPVELLDGLPEPGEPLVRVGPLNIQQFEALVVPELRSLVSEGTWQMDVSSRLQYSWRLHDDWYRFAKSGGYPLEGREIRIPDSPARGLAYRTEDVSQQDELSALKILWNIWSNHWSLGSIRVDFELLKLAENKLTTRFTGTLERVYPSWLGHPQKLDQVFREKLSWAEPKALSDMKWLTFRFTGDREDMVWLYSPATRVKRMLTGSNRSDNLYDFPITLDDVFVWSGKVENVRPRIIGKVYAFTPFMSPTVRSVKERGGSCLTSGQSSMASVNSSALRWNFESRRYLNSAGWLPSDAFWVPRELWQVELSQEDSHSLYGRQVLYVDSAMMLPIYKLVYSKAGRLWKIVFGAYSLATHRSTRDKFPIPEFTISVDLLNGTQAIFDVRSFEFCTAETDTLLVKDFDPSKLGPVAQATEQPL